MILVLFAGVLWGLSGVFGQFLFQQREIPPVWIAQQRLIIPGLILLSVAFFKQQDNSIFAVWKSPPDAIRLVVYSILGSMAVQLTFLITVSYSNAATGTILQFLSPVVISIYLIIRLRTPPPPITIIAILLACLGTFLLVTHGNINSLSISRTALIWGISSAFASAFYVMYPPVLMLRWGTWTIIGWSMFIGGLSLTLVNNPFSLPGIWDAKAFWAMFYMVIPGSVVTFSLYLIGAQAIGGQKASILTSSEPLSAAIFSVFLLNVHLNMMDWLGTLCIITTVIILALGQKKQ